MSSHICPNCNNEFAGNFCNNCGQKVAHRITMPHIWHDLIHAFTHTDKGFFHVILQMFRNPGKVTREYIIENKRKRYFSPFQYLIIIAAIGTFIAAGTHMMDELMKAMGATADAGSQQEKIMRQVTALQTKYFNIQVLLQIPFFSFATFLIYKNHRFNYAEHLTLQSFITAQTTLVTVVLMLVIYMLDHSNGALMTTGFSVMMIASVFYQVRIYMLFFKENTFKGFLKAGITYVIGFCFFMLTFALLALIAFLIYAIFTGKI